MVHKLYLSYQTDQTDTYGQNLVKTLMTFHGDR